MVEPTLTGIVVLVKRVRQTMLAGNADLLDELIDDASIFINQFGAVLDKADDLAAHRSGQLKLTRIDAEDQRIAEMVGGAVVTVLCRLAGSFDGQPFDAPSCIGHHFRNCFGKRSSPNNLKFYCRQLSTAGPESRRRRCS